MSITIYVDGETYNARQSLAANGYSFDRSQKFWSKQVDEPIPSDPAQHANYAERHGAKLPGCRAMARAFPAMGIYIYTSEIFVQPKMLVDEMGEGFLKRDPDLL